MQHASNPPPIEFRARISIHYDECPALWKAFNNIPTERRGTSILLMLTRLKTLEKLFPPVINDPSRLIDGEAEKPALPQCKHDPRDEPASVDTDGIDFDLFDWMVFYANRN